MDSVSSKLDLGYSMPDLLAERPDDVPCSECGQPVQPVACRGGWFPAGIHSECRSRRAYRAARLVEAEACIVKTIPSAYHGLSLVGDSLRRHRGNSEALQVLADWQPHQSVILHGPVGTGKTASLCAFAQDQMRRLRVVQYYSEGDVAAYLKRHMQERQADCPLDRLLCSHVLVIDDIGTARPTEWWVEQFAALVDRAYGNERAIVLSTNLSEQELIDHYPYSGQRLVSRLRHMTAPSRWVTCSGVNFRQIR